MVKKSEQEDLVNDVESLQLAQDERIFIKASNFHFTPSANNALEVTNNIIKKENTLRERLLLSRFKVLAFEIVEKWSKCYEKVDKLKWLDGVCNCAAFFKKFMCKHVVSMAIRLDHCKPPPAAKNVKIGDKKSRGRPSKSKKSVTNSIIFC
ncbi:unnamed protein product [Rotaria magnacalcarata]|uniref:SWIM-type domain-containing protein n=1 Tax=Rotaria magnacalcarata TaxID=392030 RepID=A0A8S2N8I5_9BILA|nr:unnamed protein product [Rotaria magnacalcarata]CAF4015016.1 unnamed protein product [Rotaria magnacalcarata]